MSNIATFQGQDLEIADLEQAAGGFSLNFSFSRPKTSNSTSTTSFTNSFNGDNRVFGISGNIGNRSMVSNTVVGNGVGNDNRQGG